MFLAVCLGFGNLCAQEERSRIERQLPDSVKYVLPGFRAGRVIYDNGTYSNGRLNISTFSDELLFVDDNGEILSLVDNERVDLVVIGEHVFYHRQREYMAVVDKVGEVILGSMRKMIFSDDKTGPFGTRSPSIATQSIGFIQDNTGSIYFLNQDSDYEIKDIPCIFHDDRMNVPTRRAILKAFPDKSKAIRGYLRNNQVNFSSLDDLRTLFRYIGTL